jgi:hypothetical protein
MINKFKLFWNTSNFNKFLAITTVFTLPILFGITSGIVNGGFIDFIRVIITLIIFGVFLLWMEIQ